MGCTRAGFYFPFSICHFQFGTSKMENEKFEIENGQTLCRTNGMHPDTSGLPALPSIYDCRGRLL
jgi:hypothetical protein